MTFEIIIRIEEDWSNPVVSTSFKEWGSEDFKKIKVIQEVVEECYEKIKTVIQSSNDQSPDIVS